MKVAILGAGPSGLIAAQAAVRAGVAFGDITILSRPREKAGSPFARVSQKVLSGAHWLQRPIHGVDNGVESIVSVKFLGDVAGYRDRVYGEGYRGKPMDSHFFEPHSAWDLRRVYNGLWHKFESSIFPEDIHQHNRAEVLHMLAIRHHLIINTLPRQVFCRDADHMFLTQKVWQSREMCPIPCPPNTVVYNGSPEGSWFRVSSVFGQTTAEWSQANGVRRPPISGLAEVDKPISTDCTCHGDSILHVGPMAQWDKHVLGHNIFDTVFSKCSEGVS